MKLSFASITTLLFAGLASANLVRIFVGAAFVFEQLLCDLSIANRAVPCRNLVLAAGTPTTIPAKVKLVRVDRLASQATRTRKTRICVTFALLSVARAARSALAMAHAFSASVGPSVMRENATGHPIPRRTARPVTPSATIAAPS